MQPEGAPPPKGAVPPPRQVGGGTIWAGSRESDPVATRAPRNGGGGTEPVARRGLTPPSTAHEAEPDPEQEREEECENETHGNLLGRESKMNRALRAAKENIDLLVTIAGAVGFGSVAAMAEDARQMIAEHPASCLLLTGAAAMLGYATARIVTARSSWAKRRRMDERLSAVFLGMSRRRKELVSRALDDGSVSLSPLDADALALCELGIFGTPPVGSMLTATDFSIRPAVIRTIAGHRSEWLA